MDEGEQAVDFVHPQPYTLVNKLTESVNYAYIPVACCVITPYTKSGAVLKRGQGSAPK